ncbi:THAP domain-containing protein 2-like [Odontomachus brunneus]|uniref:THAP domain-containing protein 2-like n=1 Tax=Odontomachus brunneus TaxID=486640 RepID=UPI0013F23124|nr:THAP domain-containing protein 2-like [Odontomachus brunneus]
MKTCCACGFRENRDTIDGNERVSYHSFPKKKDMRQAWVRAIGKKDFVPTKSSILCSQHFSKECLYYPNNGGHKQRIRLRPDSVPTLFDAYFWKRKNMKLRIQSKQSQNDKSKVNEGLNTKVKSEPVESDTNTKSLYVKLDESRINIKNTDREQSLTSRRKRRHYTVYPKYIGFCTINDLRSPVKVLHNWKMAMSCISSQRKEISILKRNNYCLKTKVAILEMLLSSR